MFKGQCSPDKKACKVKAFVIKHCFVFSVALGVSLALLAIQAIKVL